MASKLLIKIRSLSYLRISIIKPQIACIYVILSVGICAAGDAKAVSNVGIGVYYYPGWSPNIPESPRKDPWQPIRKYRSRLPASGEYNDSDPQTLRHQLTDMGKAGLSFVVFDTYTSQGGGARGDQAVNAYLKVASSKDPRFAIMWANHDSHLSSYRDWEVIVNRWAHLYINDPRYLRVSGAPVIFIFSPENLDRRARTFGSSTKELLARAQQISLKIAGQHISFVAGGGPRPTIIKGQARAWGYSGLSDYNMGTSKYPALGSGYTRRAYVYSRYWEVYRRDADLPVILPMTVGWDKSPWGGSDEDAAIPSPAQFKEHIAAGLAILEKQPDDLGRLGVICCWNEYGEGSVLEPTIGGKDGLLKAVKAALRLHARAPSVAVQKHMR